MKRVSKPSGKPIQGGQQSLNIASPKQAPVVGVLTGGDRPAIGGKSGKAASSKTSTPKTRKKMY